MNQKEQMTAPKRRGRPPKSEKTIDENLLSLNKIWRKYIKNATPFAKWMVVEKQQFQKIKPKDMEFHSWVNEKYKINGQNAWLNADGEVRKEVKSWLDTVNDIADTLSGKKETTDDTTTDDTTPPKDVSDEPKRILGLNQYLFYGMVGVVLIGGTILISNSVKGKGKKK